MTESALGYTGKCCVCGEEKPLESMVRHEGKKGRYHCIDDEATIYASFQAAKISEDISPTKLQKVMAWLLG